MAVDFRTLLGAKTYEELIEQYETRFKFHAAANGVRLTNWSNNSKLKTIARVDSEMVAAMYDLLVDDLSVNLDITTSSGVWTDIHLRGINETRKLSTFAEWNQTFNRAVATTGTFTVLKGTLVSTVANSEGNILTYVTQEDIVVKGYVSATGTLSATGTSVVCVGAKAGIEFQIGDKIDIGAVGVNQRTVVTITNVNTFTVNSAFTGDPISAGTIFRYTNEYGKGLIKAEKSGTEYNVDPDMITVLTTANSDVLSTTNATGDDITLARNDETDQQAIQRYLDAWSEQSITGSAPMYIKIAKTIESIIDVSVDDQLPRGAGTANVYYTKNTGIPPFIVGTGTITGTTASPTITGTNTFFLTDYKIGDTLVADTGSVGTVIKSIESDTSYTAKANPSGNFTTDTYTWVNTSEVQLLFDAEDNKILNSDVEAKVPVANPNDWLFNIKMHPTLGDEATLISKAIEIIEAFYVPDTSWPDVGLLKIGRDIQRDFVALTLFQNLEDEGFVNVDFTTPAAFPVAIAVNEKPTKGTVTITATRITL